MEEQLPGQPRPPWIQPRDGTVCPTWATGQMHVADLGQSGRSGKSSGEGRAS